MTDARPLVYVVDDDESVRKALGRLLRSAGLRVETFASAQDYLGHDGADVPGCLVLDVYLPGLDGLELQRALNEAKDSLPIVFITGHGDIPMTVRAMKAGAVDFLPKPFDDRDLLAAVRQAVANDVQARQAKAKVSEVRQRVESLTPREREVLALVVSGLMNKQIGHRLGVTVKTVKVHRSQVMRKMNARSLAELVHLAERIGVTSPPR